ncbi:hypothetical protein [Sphingomonas sp. 22176]|uniref:hypothetical protein n=1 Tax=Sphingomonas sp. 22176 TaxID=3453884 RepID=UPI003F83F665
MALLYFNSTVMVVWATCILTRPWGGRQGFPRQARGEGGLGVSHPLATATLSVAIVLLLLFVPQRAGSSHVEVAR